MTIVLIIELICVCVFGLIYTVCYDFEHRKANWEYSWMNPQFAALFFFTLVAGLAVVMELYVTITEH